MILTELEMMFLRTTIAFAAGLIAGFVLYEMFERKKEKKWI